MLASLESFAKPQSIKNMKSGFQLKILATNWGFNGTIEEYFAKVKNDGYDGIEIWWPTEQKEQDEMFAFIKENTILMWVFYCRAMKVIIMNILMHLQQVTEAAATNSVQKPLYINCHSGKDYF